MIILFLFLKLLETILTQGALWGREGGASPPPHSKRVGCSISVAHVALKLNSHLSRLFIIIPECFSHHATPRAASFDIHVLLYRIYFS